MLIYPRRNWLFDISYSEWWNWSCWGKTPLLVFSLCFCCYTCSKLQYCSLLCLNVVFGWTPKMLASSKCLPTQFPVVHMHIHGLRHASVIVIWNTFLIIVTYLKDWCSTALFSSILPMPVDLRLTKSLRSFIARPKYTNIIKLINGSVWWFSDIGKRPVDVRVTKALYQGLILTLIRSYEAWAERKKQHN